MKKCCLSPYPVCSLLAEYMFGTVTLYLLCFWGGLEWQGSYLFLQLVNTAGPILYLFYLTKQLFSWIVSSLVLIFYFLFLHGSLMARCQVTRPLGEVMMLSTPFSAKLVLGSMFPVRSS